MGNLLSTIGTPLYYAISAIWLAWHRLFDLLPISQGWAWALAIVGLTVTIRGAADTTGDTALVPATAKGPGGTKDFEIGLKNEGGVWCYAGDKTE